MTTDAYVAYTHRFFAKWVPYYDLFALAIFFVYDRAVRAAVPRRGTKVLDLCTGTGEIALRCARAGAEVTAVDLTPGMLEQAKAKAGSLPIQFLLMDARRLSFPDRSFASTVLSFALHDMPKRVRFEVLAEAARVTAQRLVVLDYDFPRWPPARRLVAAMLATFETAYLRGFSNDGVAPLLAEAGLVASRTVRFTPLPFAIHVVELGPAQQT